jgi:hypothetical protein
MTIDEAIKERQKVIEVQEKLYEEASSDESKEIIKSAIDNDRQLAEWLTELKQWRRVYGVCPSYEMCIPECKEGYNAQIAEYKRLLKMAVEDISKMTCNNDTHSPDSCYICDKHGNCSYADSFKWCKADEALKLIGEANNDEP